MQLTVATYEPLRPVIAAWSLEHPECYAAVFAQSLGNSLHIIGSRSWPMMAPSECFADVQGMPWKRATLNLLPSDDTAASGQVFDTAGLNFEYLPNYPPIVVVQMTRELLPVLVIDNAPRPWEGGTENNERLVESLNGYRHEPMRSQPGTFSPAAAHSWEVYLVRAVELLACWRFMGGSDAWGPDPNDRRHNDGQQHATLARRRARQRGEWV